MGMSTHLNGVKPADETFKKHLKVWKACEEAGVSVPEETSKFFNHDSPDEKGVVVYLKKGQDGVSEYHTTSGGGFEVDLRKLPKDIKIIRFYNAW